MRGPWSPGLNFGWRLQAIYAYVWVKWPGTEKEIGLRVFAIGSQCIVIPKPTVEVLMEAELTIYEDAVIDEMKLKVWMKIGMFGQNLCKIIVYLLPNVLLVWVLSLTREQKQKACFCSLDSIT